MCQKTRKNIALEMKVNWKRGIYNRFGKKSYVIERALLQVRQEQNLN